MKVRHGSSLDGKSDLHSSNPPNLRYFMYSPPSTCSEERLERLRRGEALFPTAARQMQTFLQTNALPVQPFPAVSTHKYTVSKDMREYMAQKTFEPQLEIRKQGSLDRFFKEKYAIISDLLGNPITAGGLSVVQTARCDVDIAKSCNSTADARTAEAFTSPCKVKATYGKSSSGGSNWTLWMRKWTG